jgi:hypothetical protein
MPQRSYNDPILVKARKKKEKLKAKQFMTSDVAYTGKKKINKKIDKRNKRKGKKSKIKRITY